MFGLRGWCLVGLFAVMPVYRAAAAEPPAPRGGETVFFAFDDRSIPWWNNLKLTLVQAKKHPANPVLRRGPEGTPDHGHAVLYGTVVKDGDKFRMWYLGMIQDIKKYGDAAGWYRPMCYAESSDGVQWTKPDLGLVELNGNRHNNICRIEGESKPLTLVNDFLSVLYEPDDPDPSRRYKVAYIAHMLCGDIKGGMRNVTNKQARLCTFVCATSADGLRWKVVGDRPVNAGGVHFEVSSLYRFGRFYYAAGQSFEGRPDGGYVGRVMQAYRSPDFLSWSSAQALAFARPGQLTNPPQEGQQTHMGAGLWNRGNVLVGLYGMWEDGPKERPKGSTREHNVRIDLGLIVSNDGIHFREPVPNFKVIERGRADEWDSIALLQGHAFVQVADKTYIWYSQWDTREADRPMEIGLATLRRDGFGYLARKQTDLAGHCITSTVPKARAKRSVRVNVEGVSEAHPLTVELLDAQDRPLAGYSGANAAKIVKSGTRQLVEWPARADRSAPSDTEFSIRATFPQSGDVRLYAVYVGP